MSTSPFVEGSAPSSQNDRVLEAMLPLVRREAENGNDPEPYWERLNDILHQDYDVFNQRLMRAGFFDQYTLVNNYRSQNLLSPDEQLQSIVAADAQVIEQLEGITNADIAEVFEQVQQAALESPVHDLATFPGNYPDTRNILNFGNNAYLLQVCRGVDGSNYIIISKLDSEEKITCNFLTSRFMKIGFFGGQFNRFDPIRVISFFPHLIAKLSPKGQAFFHDQVALREAQKQQEMLEKHTEEEQLRTEVARLHSVIEIHVGYLHTLKSTLRNLDEVMKPDMNRQKSFETEVSEIERNVVSRYISKDQGLRSLIERLESKLRDFQISAARIEPDGIEYFLESIKQDGLTPEEYVNVRIKQIQALYLQFCHSLTKHNGRMYIWSDYSTVNYVKTLLSMTDTTDEYPAFPPAKDFASNMMKLLKTVQGGIMYGAFSMWGGSAYAADDFFEVSIGCKHSEYNEREVGPSALQNNSIVVSIKPKYKLAPGCTYPFSKVQVTLQAGRNYGRDAAATPEFGPFQVGEDGVVEIPNLYTSLQLSDDELKRTYWYIKE